MIKPHEPTTHSNWDYDGLHCEGCGEENPQWCIQCGACLCKEITCESGHNLQCPRRQYMNELAVEIYDIAKSRGFTDWEDNLLYIPMRLALIHAEVSEALEAHRIGDSQNLEEEIADIMIRTLLIANYLDMDIDGAVHRKLNFNRTRPYESGGKRY